LIITFLEVYIMNIIVKILWYILVEALLSPLCPERLGFQLLNILTLGYL
jgi:hypothetical protein